VGKKASAWCSALVATLGLASSCKSPGPCYGLGVGSRVSITIVDYYTGNPAYPQDERALSPSRTTNPCDVFGFDIAKNMVLEATVEANPSTDEDCSVGVATFGPVGSWTWSPTSPPPQPGRPTVLEGAYNASNGVCRGSVDIRLMGAASGQDVFATAAPGQVPPVVMLRGFSGAGPIGDASAGACPSECVGDFVVDLKRLN
jgi:hypothetical protein